MRLLQSVPNPKSIAIVSLNFAKDISRDNCEIYGLIRLWCATRKASLYGSIAFDIILTFVRKRRGGLWKRDGNAIK